MKRAFTLVELLLVVAIVLVIGTLSTAWYSRFLVQNEVDTTTDRIIQSLRKAQYYSMISRKSNSSGWGVNYAGTTLTVFQGATYAGRNAALDETFTVNSSVTVAGLSSITFGRLRGLPSGAATITISGQNTSRTIAVNTEGRISR